MAWRLVDNGRMLFGYILIMKTILLLILLQVILPSTREVKADFEQTKRSPMFASDQHARGRFEYRYPDYVRWEYTEPERILYEMNGKKNNVSPVIRNLMLLIGKCVSGEISRDDDSLEISYNDHVAYVKPKRRDLRNLFSSMILKYDAKTGRATQVVLSEKDGSVTTITFKYAK